MCALVHRGRHPLLQRARSPPSAPALPRSPASAWPTRRAAALRCTASTCCSRWTGARSTRGVGRGRSWKRTSPHRRWTFSWTSSPCACPVRRGARPAPLALLLLGAAGSWVRRQRAVFLDRSPACAHTCACRASIPVLPPDARGGVGLLGAAVAQRVQAEAAPRRRRACARVVALRRAGGAATAGGAPAELEAGGEGAEAGRGGGTRVQAQSARLREHKRAQ